MEVNKYDFKLREKDVQRITDGSSFWCLVLDGKQAVSTGWLAYRQHFYIGETDFGFDMAQSDTGLLYDFNTMAEHRGKGYYGLRVHEAALAKGVKVTGATAHFVNEICDGGPIIIQKAVEIYNGDTPEILQKRVMTEAEWIILPLSVEKISSNITKE